MPIAHRTSVFELTPAEWLAQAAGSSGRVGTHDVQRSIDFALAVENLTPALHLPVLAGPAQGPGFPNLSCLGLLADRVLQPYLTRASQLRQEYRTTDV